MADLVRGNFCLEGYIDVPTDKRSLIAEALDQHIRLTLGESGCIYFSVDKCPEVEGRYLVSEAFVSEDAFQHHQERASNSEWAKASEGIPRHYDTWVVE